MKPYILIFFLFIAGNAVAEENRHTNFFNEEWLKSVISIEKKSDNSYKPIGTGFIVSTEKRSTVLITAKHVIFDKNGNYKGNIHFRFTTDNGSYLVADKYLTENNYGPWFPSKTNDVALRYVGVRKDTSNLRIPHNMMLEKKEVEAGTSALVMGYPMGLRSEKFPTAILRRAMVALAEGDQFLFDSLVFPGNSGGPIIYVPPVGFKLTNFENRTLLLGVVSSYLPYLDTAYSLQTKRPRITFEENSGLTKAVPVEAIKGILYSEEFMRHEETIRSQQNHQPDGK